MAHEGLVVFFGNAHCIRRAVALVLGNADIEVRVAAYFPDGSLIDCIVGVFVFDDIEL